MTYRPTKRQRTLTGHSADTDNTQTGLRCPLEANVSLEEAKHNHAPWHSGWSSSLQISHFPAGLTEEYTASSAHWPVDKEGAQALSKTNQSHCRPEDAQVVATSAEQSPQVDNTTPATIIERVDEDIIDDYDSCEELFTKHFSTQNLAHQNAKRKLPHRNSSSNATMSKDRCRLEKSIVHPKRFILPSESTNRGNIAHCGNLEDGNEPWAQRFQPLNIDELAVHKKKVSDVRRWLEDSFMGTDKSRLLVLRGPAGSGKTATISLLSRALGFDILEWKSPLVSQQSSRGYVSVSSRFDEFLGRCHDFKRLDLSEERGAPQAGIDAGLSLCPRRIVLIEEFPTLSNTWSSSVAAFRFSLYRYLAMETPSTPKASFRGLGSNEVPPIVIIVSEALLNFSSETLTVNRLLGPEVCNHPHTTIIDFNSIAPTIMYKALNDILQKRFRHSKDFRLPKAAVLHSISKIGDIRSAVSSLEFLCRGAEDIGKPTKGVSRTLRKPQDSEVLTPSEKETLKLVTHRETSLGLFHAVGKIIYNKREDKNITADVDSFAPTPSHLSRHDRPKVPQVSVNELVDSMGTDIQTFVYALHENYAPSCNGPSFTDCLDGCIEALSDSDALCFNPGYARKSWAGAKTGVNHANASIDAMRQQDISYQVATRGLLFALPNPVKRQAKNGERASEAHKLSFPSSFRLSYDTEELESILNMWQKKILQQLSQSKPDPLEGLYTPSILEKPGGNNTKCKTTGNCNRVHSPIVTMMSRRDILLYQLPYMVKMSQNRSYLSEPRKLVELHGISSQYDDHVDFASHRHSSAAPRVSDGVSPMLEIYNHSSTLQLSQAPDHEADERRLLLSDDDIIDD